MQIVLLPLIILSFTDFFFTFSKSSAEDYCDKRHSSSTNGLTVYVEMLGKSVVRINGMRKTGNAWVGELAAAR